MAIGIPYEQFETVESQQTATYDLLADSRRRLILSVLFEQDSTVSLENLVDEVVFYESAGEPGVHSSHEIGATKDRRSVRISLHHVHLPKLAEAGAVVYDVDDQTVRCTDHGRTLYDRLDAICGTPRETDDRS